MSRLEKALIIKPNWGNLILDGKKTWEIRSSSTNIRGRIGIAFSGTSAVWGTVNLVNCIKLNKEVFESNKDKHQIDYNFEELPYKNVYAWVFEDVKRLKEPIGYNHKRGCVIWCNLDDEFNKLLTLAIRK